MAVENVKTEAKNNMDKALVALSDALKKVRTGRAQISMLDGLRVNYYGNPTPLNQVSAVSTPDAKTFMIAPWEGQMLKEIEQAIVKSDLGMSPMNDGKVIRLKLPDLTEQRRKELVKSCHKLVEDAKVAIRMARRDANEALKTAQKDKAISEDESKRAQEDIQKLTDGSIDKADKLSQEKEKEIMTI